MRGASLLFLSEMLLICVLVWCILMIIYGNVTIKEDKS